MSDGAVISIVLDATRNGPQVHDLLPGVDTIHIARPDGSRVLSVFPKGRSGQLWVTRHGDEVPENAQGIGAFDSELENWQVFLVERGMSDEKLEQLDEPEVYVAKLGCPYKIGDPRMDVWLEGFKAGMSHGGEIATQALRDSFDEHRKDG